MHLTPEALAAMKASPSVWCMHPHGTCIGFGFSLNGAVRFKAGDEARYAPAQLLAAVDEIATIDPPPDATMERPAYLSARNCGWTFIRTCSMNSSSP